MPTKLPKMRLGKRVGRVEGKSRARSTKILYQSVNCLQFLRHFLSFGAKRESEPTLAQATSSPSPIVHPELWCQFDRLEPTFPLRLSKLGPP